MAENKPSLRVETLVCFRVDSCDLQEFIKQVYGHDYDINANEDWGDDVEQTLLDSLVADGHIPAGIYLVCGN